MKQMSSIVLAILPTVFQRNFLPSLVRSQLAFFAAYIFCKISFLCDDGTDLVVNFSLQNDCSSMMVTL